MASNIAKKAFASAKAAKVKTDKITVNNNINLDETTESIASLTNNGQIAGIVTLTQAEYDALPATKETDGVVYLIRG